MSTLSIVIGDHYYTKDPQSSDLGKQIIVGSIALLDKIGFEEFTFKKLAEQISSTEASIYRYFENKHKLLVYLTTWYWSWVDYAIDYKTHFIKNSKDKLSEILKIICHLDVDAIVINVPGIDVPSLRRVVVIEADKTYLTKNVDEINNQGLYKAFKGLCHKIALVIQELDGTFKYPHSIVSTIIEVTHQQAFFAQHLPSLTEIKKEADKSIEMQVYDFLMELVNRLLINTQK